MTAQLLTAMVDFHGPVFPSVHSVAAFVPRRRDSLAVCPGRPEAVCRRIRGLSLSGHTEIVLKHILHSRCIRSSVVGPAMSSRPSSDAVLEALRLTGAA